MTVEEFEQQLANLGQELSEIDQILLAAGGRLVRDLKQRAPVDTGDLRSSIQAVVTDQSLTIQMLSYGLYQNFGVSGTEDTLGITVPEGIFPGPRTGDTYSFQTRRFGIKPQQFFNMEQLTENLIQALEERIQNILNNN